MTLRSLDIRPRAADDTTPGARGYDPDTGWWTTTQTPADSTSTSHSGPAAAGTQDRR